MATCATVVGVSVINGVAVDITVATAESTVETACVTTVCADTTSGVWVVAVTGIAATACVTAATVEVIV